MKKMLSLLLTAILAFTFVACGSTTSSTSVSVAPFQPVSLSEPEPVPLEQAFLTGLEKTAEYPEGQRICAVMVGNGIPGRKYPMMGLSEAQIVVEIEANAQVTRLMGIFENYKTMPQVGQVRSAREQFFQLILPFRAFFVHDGPSEASEPVNVLLDVYEYDDYDLNTGTYGSYGGNGSLAWRESWAGPYNEYTDGEHIEATILNNGMDDYKSYNSPIFNFVPYTEPARVPEGGAAPSVTVTHCAGYLTGFEYDSAAGRYNMSMYQGGGMQPTIDEGNNQQLAFENVLVLYAPFSIYPNTGSEALPKIDFSTGPGYYFSQGQYEFVTWEKGSPEAALQVYKGDKSGEQLQVNTGKTYLAIVNDTRFEDFHYSVVEGMAGNVNEEDTNAGGGDVD